MEGVEGGLCPEVGQKKITKKYPQIITKWCDDSVIKAPASHA